MRGQILARWLASCLIFLALIQIKLASGKPSRPVKSVFLLSDIDVNAGEKLQRSASFRVIRKRYDEQVNNGTLSVGNEDSQLATGRMLSGPVKLAEGELSAEEIENAYDSPARSLDSTGATPTMTTSENAPSSQPIEEHHEELPEIIASNHAGQSEQQELQHAYGPAQVINQNPSNESTSVQEQPVEAQIQSSIQVPIEQKLAEQTVASPEVPVQPTFNKPASMPMVDQQLPETEPKQTVIPSDPPVSINQTLSRGENLVDSVAPVTQTISDKVPDIQAPMPVDTNQVEHKSNEEKSIQTIAPESNSTITDADPISNTVDSKKDLNQAKVQLSHEEQQRHRYTDETLRLVDPIKLLDAEDGTQIELDPNTCFSSDQFNHLVPNAILNMTVARIMSVFKSSDCNQMINFRLKPMKNKMIRRKIMQVGSMPIDVGQLAYAPLTRVTCGKPVQLEDGLIKFRLILDQEHDDQWLSSRWRLHPALSYDELPIKFANEINTLKERARTIEKCSSFKVEAGNFYLELLNFKTQLEIEVNLAKLGDQTYTASSSKLNEQQKGGSIRVIDFRVRQLYLDHGIRLDGQLNEIVAAARKQKSLERPNSTSRGLYMPEALQREIQKSSVLSTVQILHDNNNHVRKNNWLFDLFANWMKHECRHQLKHLLARPFVDRVNLCFDHQPSTSLNQLASS